MRDRGPEQRTKLKAQKKKDDAEAAAKAAAEAASLARTSSKKAKEIARNALRSARRNLKALVNSNEAVKLFGVLEDGFDVMEDGIEWVNQELPEPELRALKEALQTKLDADGDQARRAAPCPQARALVVSQFHYYRYISCESC